MVHAGPGQAPDRGAEDVTIYNLFGYDYTPGEGTDNKAAIGEFVATTLFVYVGCGVAVSTQAFVAFGPGELDNDFLLGVSIAFGFAISVLAYSVAPISGGHINPAVSFAFFILKDLPLTEFISYVVAQCAGATLGAALVWGSFASSKLVDDGGDTTPPFLVGSNFVHSEIPLGSAFLAETMGTFLLVWTVLMTAVNTHSIAGNLAPMAIGWSVMLAHLLLIPITTCGINPARSFGPHMISIMAGETVGVRGWWIFYTAPFLGAALAAIVCKYVFGVMQEEEQGTEEEKVTILPDDDKDLEKEQPPLSDAQE
jgi:aquaporin PIP